MRKPLSINKSGRSSVWLERLLWEQEVVGSNPVAPTISIWSASAQRTTRNGNLRREERLRFPVSRLDSRLMAIYFSEAMSFARLPLQLRLASIACLLLAAWIVYDLSHWWSIKEDYSFGYLVPVFCAFVLYDRWPAILRIFNPSPLPESSPQGPKRWLDAIGGICLTGSVLVFVLGVLYRGYTGISLPGSFLMTNGFAGIVLSSALVFSDRRTDGAYLDNKGRLAFFGMLLFPALVWIISAPLMSAVESMISVFLLNKVTAVVFGVFDMLGMLIERRGNVLILPKGEVGVEEACSGIRSLTGCLFAGSFLAAVFLDKLWKKVLMVGTALLLAFATNLARGLFLTSWAYAYGSEAIAGTVHDVTGYAVLGVTVILLLCLLPVFNFKLPELAEAEPSQNAQAKGDDNTAKEEQGQA